jgi:biopolymer transport protein ExbB
MNWEISTWEYLATGGPVMVPLLLVSLAMAFMIAERFLYFAGIERGDINADAVIRGIENNAPAAGGGLCATVLGRLLAARAVYGELDLRVLHETVQGFLPELRRGFNIIACLIAAAPLLGLLGTVTGMIETFNVMNIFGTTNPKAMSGGISEAMITTQYGLVLAILGMYVQMFVEKRARRCEHMVEELTRHIIRKFQL